MLPISSKWNANIYDMFSKQEEQFDIHNAHHGGLTQ